MRVYSEYQKGLKGERITNNKIEFNNESNWYSISTYKDIAGTTWWFSIIETEENKYELGWFKID